MVSGGAGSLGPRGIGRGISNMENRREFACICVMGKSESRDWMCSDRDWWIAGRSDERSILFVSLSYKGGWEHTRRSRDLVRGLIIEIAGVHLYSLIV